MLRVILIAVFFLSGIGLIVAGWKMTGEFLGLGIMLGGLVLLLAAMWLYNKVFQ